MSVDAVIVPPDRRVSIFFFDNLRYSQSMATRSKPALLEPAVCCAPVTTTALEEEQADVLAHSFAALADPIRLRLLSFIASSDQDEVCACELVTPSGRSQPTVSHHMKILVNAGLVAREKRGLWVWYRVVPERLEALRAALG
jgi:ArsR family transcriptional regulator